MTVAIVPIWLSSVTCAVFLLLCLVVLYILLKEEIQAWLLDREESKVLKMEEDEYQAKQDALKEAFKKAGNKNSLFLLPEERDDILKEEQVFLTKLSPELQKEYHEFKNTRDANVVFDQSKDDHV